MHAAEGWGSGEGAGLLWAALDERTSGGGAWGAGWRGGSAAQAGLPVIEGANPAAAQVELAGVAAALVAGHLQRSGAASTHSALNTRGGRVA